MSGALTLLAVWLTPAVWLSMSSAIAERGPEGLWIGFTLVAAPLVAVAARRSASGADEAPLRRFRRGVLLVAGGILMWANAIVAGDVAPVFGIARWQALVVAMVLGWAALAWRGATRLVPAIALVGIVALGLPLAELVRQAGTGPLAAWEHLATQPAFRFPASSAWVTEGRSLGPSRAQTSLVFSEEHSVSAPAGGVVRAQVFDGRDGLDREWILAPGQSVTFRTGDRLEIDASTPLRFEAGKRVPGAPTSGMAWAGGSPDAGGRALGISVTLVAGAIGLLGSAAARVSRRDVVAIGVGLVAALGWAQGWAIYQLLAGPDLFLGGVTIERLVDVGALESGRLTGMAMQALVLIGGTASFLASSIALRSRVALPPAAAGTRDDAVWAGIVALAGLAAVWPVDPWPLVVLAAGIAAAALTPATLWPPANPRAAVGAGVVALVVFAVVTVVSGLRVLGVGPSSTGASTWWGMLRDAIATYPALAALPAGAIVLLALRRRRGRRAPAASRLVRR
jgi:hypothetical protein